MIAAMEKPLATRTLIAVTADASRIALIVVTDSSFATGATPGFGRWQQQVCRARTAEGFSERSRIAQISRECFCAFVDKAL
jgi:hypothetical protein